MSFSCELCKGINPANVCYFTKCVHPQQTLPEVSQHRGKQKHLDVKRHEENCHVTNVATKPIAGIQTQCYYSTQALYEEIFRCQVQDLHFLSSFLDFGLAVTVSGKQ